SSGAAVHAEHQLGQSDHTAPTLGLCNLQQRVRPIEMPLPRRMNLVGSAAAAVVTFRWSARPTPGPAENSPRSGKWHPVECRW
ncbi:MAG TPA: hypothetical protein VK797_09280, partial [Tepidisphaeraceae bacterium]|nr:hypothetical protein [Tepidisphaeraceae bacterium]